MTNAEYTVYFRSVDWFVASAMVESRYGYKRQHGVRNQKVMITRSDIDIDLYGSLAEIAVAKALGCEIKIASYLGGDPGYDLTFMDKTIEVKYTFHENGRLLVPEYKKEKLIADYYFLLHGNKKAMNILGWTDLETYLRKGHTVDLGYGPSWILDREYMKPFLSFIDDNQEYVQDVDRNASVKYCFEGSRFEDAVL